MGSHLGLPSWWDVSLKPPAAVSAGVWEGLKLKHERGTQLGGGRSTGVPLCSKPDTASGVRVL